MPPPPVEQARAIPHNIRKVPEMPFIIFFRNGWDTRYMASMIIVSLYIGTEVYKIKSVNIINVAVVIIIESIVGDFVNP